MMFSDLLFKNPISLDNTSHSDRLDDCCFCIASISPSKPACTGVRILCKHFKTAIFIMNCEIINCPYVPLSAIKIYFFSNVHACVCVIENKGVFLLERVLHYYSINAHRPWLPQPCSVTHWTCSGWW